jgi:hypothetical protein
MVLLFSEGKTVVEEQIYQGRKESYFECCGLNVPGDIPMEISIGQKHSYGSGFRG